MQIIFCWQKDKILNLQQVYMNDSKKRTLVDVLLIEDNIVDVRLLEEAFQEEQLNVNLQSVLDGEEALDFLLKKNKHSKATTPDLIILDLNLPKLNGHEILKRIKDDPNLKTIPVIILTSSQSEEDIINSYKLQANSYIKKPFDLDGFRAVVRSIDQFWFTIAKLPKNDA